MNGPLNSTHGQIIVTHVMSRCQTKVKIIVKSIHGKVVVFVIISCLRISAVLFPVPVLKFHAADFDNWPLSRLNLLSRSVSWPTLTLSQPVARGHGSLVDYLAQVI